MERDKDNLTPKQAHFARCVAAGSSYSDAYREAYLNPSSQMTAKTVNEKGSRLMAQGKIRARVEALQRAREAAIVRAGVTDKDRVLRKLRDLLEGAERQSDQLRAAELLGRSCGLYVDRTETTTATRDPVTLRQELERRIDALVSRSKH